MENLVYAITSFGFIFLSIILFSSLLIFYKKKFRNFKEQENLKYNKLSKSFIYTSIILDLLLIVGSSCIIISQISSDYIDGTEILIFILIITYLLINLSALLNIRSDNILFMFLEKRRLETEIAVIQKRKELEKLKAENK